MLLTPHIQRRQGEAITKMSCPIFENHIIIGSVVNVCCNWLTGLEADFFTTHIVLFNINGTLYILYRTTIIDIGHFEKFETTIAFV